MPKSLNDAHFGWSVSCRDDRNPNGGKLDAKGKTFLEPRELSEKHGVWPLNHGNVLFLVLVRVETSKSLRFVNQFAALVEKDGVTVERDSHLPFRNLRGIFRGWFHESGGAVTPINHSLRVLGVRGQ